MCVNISCSKVIVRIFEMIDVIYWKIDVIGEGGNWEIRYESIVCVSVVKWYYRW